LVLSWIAGEAWIVPAVTATWVSLLYLATLGTIVVFLLFLYLTNHWQASSVSYQFVLTPFVGVALGAILAGEPVTPALVAGGALVLAGVYFGALTDRGG
jgi:drug/metabolite transporter (DMT)-like permease